MSCEVKIHPPDPLPLPKEGGSFLRGAGAPLGHPALR